MSYFIYVFFFQYSNIHYFIKVGVVFIKLFCLLFDYFQRLDEVQSYILVYRTLEEDHLVADYNVHGFLHLVSSLPLYFF